MDTIPGETTILRFRHLLESHDLFRVLFETINAHLSDAGLLMQRGSAVDATLIVASPSTKNKAKARDRQMTSTKKNNQWYFGMKAHIGADKAARNSRSEPENDATRPIRHSYLA